MESIIVALITGVLSLVGVVITNTAAARRTENKITTAQAVTDTKLDELTQKLDEASQAEETTQAAENEMIKSLRTELDRTEEAYEALLEAKACETREGNVTFSRAMQTLERLKDYLGQTALEEYKANHAA